MNNNSDNLIKPYKIDRVCKPHPDIDQLSLKQVDTTESIYSRVLVQLKDASLPDSVYDRIDQTERTLHKISINPETNQPTHPEPPEPPGQPEPPKPSPSPEPQPSIPVEPKIVSWDLFLMLKYRQDWLPSGYGLGELIYAISLLPNEELTIEVKTWETSKTQQDKEDEMSVRNVSDIKTSSSAANETSSGIETKTHEYIDAKAGYSGFGFSASLEAGWSEDVNTMQQQQAKQVQERSQQASNEYRSTHKVKIAISRESGSEEKTTRKIRNINQAYTLNANYYEVLREYQITLTLYDVALVLLGDEPDLAAPTSYLTWWGDSPEWITLGHMIRFSSSATWVQSFIDRYGVSPIKFLREMWSAPLYYAALVPTDWTDENVRILPEDREEFQSTMLQYVRPTPGWVEPDEKGALRWGYEVLPGQEEYVLKYLYRFLPYSVQQVTARATLAGMEPVDSYQALIARYIQAVVPSHRTQLRRATMMSRPVSVAPSLRAMRSDKILVNGHFKNVPIIDFSNDTNKVISNWVEEIVKQFNKAKEKAHVNAGIQGTWTTTLTTQSVYADLALGVCSGAEDYYEIQRQFDLELKKHEIEKLKLEVEKLKLQNQFLKEGKSVSSVIVENPTDNTEINLDIGVSTTPTKVEIKKT